MMAAVLMYSFSMSILGFILDKAIGVNCPKRLENAKILIANTCEPLSLTKLTHGLIMDSHGHG